MKSVTVAAAFLLLSPPTLNGWVDAAWGTSENNRRARFYSLTAAGREQLTHKRDEFDRIIFAIHRVLEATQ